MWPMVLRTAAESKARPRPPQTFTRPTCGTVAHRQCESDASNRGPRIGQLARKHWCWSHHDGNPEGGRLQAHDQQKPVKTGVCQIPAQSLFFLSGGGAPVELAEVPDVTFVFVLIVSTN